MDHYELKGSAQGWSNFRNKVDFTLFELKIEFKSNKFKTSKFNLKKNLLMSE